ncbi:MAG TPA: hypothetical protein V6C85_26580 [Allocoleopsis sp.]
MIIKKREEGERLAALASPPFCTIIIINKYFAAPENQDLGIVKQQGKPNLKLIVAPFPEQQRGSDQFFFQPLLKSP